ncbi:MAG: divalent-cation tolerance protein CutA, partial [Gallionella sp.]|nr:divalent-cation tolerance protein CutA [Gallionella sp.]
MNNILLVIINLPDAQSAAQLAQRLVEARAAACVNQLAPCTSTYRW